MEFFSFLENNLNIFLNEQQTEAVQAYDKRLLLEACPGSGKTTTLVTRIAYQILCRNVNPSGMLTLTFSRASAKDMERRFKALFAGYISQRIHFSTIHSFCYRFLFFCQKKGALSVPNLIEKQYSHGKTRILRSLYFETNQEYPGEDVTDQLANEISFVKNKLIQPEALKSDIENFSLIFRLYEKQKQEKHLIDFDDMLFMAYDVLRNNRQLYLEYGLFPHVHVDEVQDTSLLQHRIIELLSQDGNLFMVGDTDQSIYGFRGAEPEYIVNIRDIYPDARVLRLETNYRSSGKIVQMADQFIRQNQYRHEKNMITINAEGETPVAYFLKDMETQLQKVLQLIKAEPLWKNTAVLFRNNLSGLPVAWELIQRGIPFYIREDYASFFRHFVVSDIYAFCNFATDPSDMDSFQRIYYKMGASISKNDIGKVQEILKPSSISGKRQPNLNILTTLLQINHHRRHIAENLVRVRRGLNRIARSIPMKALETMENDLQYGNYLKRNVGFIHVFYTLKHFARNVKNLEEFKTLLRTLKEGIEQNCRKENTNAVQLLTLHGSKGLEFDSVILMDLIDGQFPDEKSIDELDAGNRKAYEEEVRLFYVGVTRARKKVYLLSPQRFEGRKIKQSRFVQQFFSQRQVKQEEEEIGNFYCSGNSYPL